MTRGCGIETEYSFGPLSWEDYKKALFPEENDKDARSNKNSEKLETESGEQVNITKSPCKEKTKWEKAYERACKNREFEIELYWKRTTYFWAFITTIYVAYYNVLTNVYDKEYWHFPLLVLSGLGLFFAVAWILTSKGSRHWQENWEHHVYLLEDKVTGPLLKIFAPNSFSVSKVNLMAGYVVATCAGGLFVFQVVKFCKHFACMNGVNPFVLYIAICGLAALGTVAFVLRAKGCVKKDDRIRFGKIEIKGDKS